MKVRQGFVSNSSSSSFVIVGYTTELTEEICQYLLENKVILKDDKRKRIYTEYDSWIERLKESQYYNSNAIDFFIIEDQLVIGKKVASAIEECDNDSYDLGELIILLNKEMKDLNKRKDFNASLKIIYGNDSEY